MVKLEKGSLCVCMCVCVYGKEGVALKKGMGFRDT
jgi:hypothetical protein